MKINKILYLFIVLGIIARLYQFSALPLSLNRDEVALGYNAYAISQKGIDEWGVKYPVMFKSFGDYKLPGYIYTLSLLIKIFGLSDWIIRLPSLISGLAIIYLSYKLAQSIGFSKNSSLFIASIISMSPWAIFYSRVGFEANLGLALFLAALLHISSQKRANKIIGVIFYILSIVTYNTPLMLFPLLIAWMIIKSTKSKKRDSFIFSSIVLVISIIWLLSIKPLISQKSGITLFSDPSFKHAQITAFSNSKNIFDRLINHQVIYSARFIVKNTLNSLLPDFLVISGGENPWHNVPKTGQIYWVTYIFFVVSLFLIIKKFSIKNKKFILSLLMVAFGLLPAITTIDAPHTTRSLISFIGITFTSAIAWKSLHKKTKYPILLILLFEFTVYSYHYFVFFPENHSTLWNVGLKQAIIQARSDYQDKTINITVPQNQPYIYTLLYQKIDPENYINSVEYYGPDSAGIEYVKSYDSWTFIGDIKDTPEDTPSIHQNKSGQFVILSDKHQTYE